MQGTGTCIPFAIVKVDEEQCGDGRNRRVAAGVNPQGSWHSHSSPAISYHGVWAATTIDNYSRHREWRIGTEYVWGAAHQAPNKHPTSAKVPSTYLAR